LSPTLDRLFAQACDLRKLPISTSSNPIGLYRHIPATLLLIQSAQEEVHLAMEDLIRMDRFLLAMRTLAVVDC